MRELTAANMERLGAGIRVFTFKEGALSRLAHDLALRAGEFNLQIDDASGAVRALIDATSLRVISAMAGGREAPELLAPSRFAEIEQNIRRSVLRSDIHPEIVFEGALVDGALEGELTLHGVRRAIQIPVREEEGMWVAELELDQRDYGIVPFTALLGTLRVQARVRVVVRVPSAP